MHKVECVVWDLDGTLVESLPATIEAFNDGLEPVLGRRLPTEELMSHFGPSEEQIIKKLVGPEQAEKSYLTVKGSMQKRLSNARLFQGISEVLDHLKSLSISMSLFTGRGREGTEFLLDQLELRHYLEDIITGSDVRFPKPHPEGLLRILENNGFSANKVLFIGDSPMDMFASRDAKTLGVGCLWDHFADENTLRAAGAQFIVRTPSEILKLLA